MRKRQHSLFPLALLLSFLFTTLTAASGPAWLTRTMPAAPTYSVSYATSCPPGEPACTEDELVSATDSDGDGHPDAVEEMAGYLEGSRTAFMSTMGMREPHFSGAPSRPAYMSGGCWGSYNGESMFMCARGTSLDRVQAQATAVHELYHAAQWAYGVGQPGWVIEGQAAMIEDAVFSDLDRDPGTFLYGMGNAYLGDPNGLAITGVGYEAAWFWKYFAERFGTLPNPSQGADALRVFWDRAAAEGVSGIEAVNRALAVLRPGATFESVYKDFVIANYARKLSDPTLPAIYRFADEAEAGPGPLRAVRMEVERAIGPGEGVGPLLSDVKAWGVRYYEVRPTPDVPLISINVRQDTASRVFYALLGIKDHRIALNEQSVGRHYSRALPNNDYDQVVLVVAGLEHRANFRMGVNSSATLQISDPLASRPARVVVGGGDKFLLKLDVLDGGATPVEGLDPASIQVRVGSTDLTPADLVTSAYVQGQYWLLLRAPDLPAGSYPVRATWSGLADTETGALVYGPREVMANTIVLDRSGSMSGSKIISARAAARLYVDSWRVGDQIGVVSFNGDATVDLSLRTLDAASRTAAHAAINAAVAGGATSIGDGATSALGELVARGRADNVWAIVLLSDGEETAPRTVDEFLADYRARRDAGERVPQIHTVALGADADRALMQRLAAETGGTYQYAAEPGGAMLAAASLPLSLSEIYRVAAEAVDRQQQILAETIALDEQQRINEFRFEVDGASELYVSLAWDPVYSGGFATLLRPDGSAIPLSAKRIDSGHNIWSVGAPPAGTWTVQIDCGGTEFCAPERLLEAAVRSPLTIDLLFSPGPADRRVGTPIQILVPLTDTGPIKGAAVSAVVTAPNGSASALALFDDGLHGDGAADDGIYGNRYVRTTQAGSYVVKVGATGTGTAGFTFVRRISRAFDIAPDQDLDQDGIPDGWEQANGTDPSSNDWKADPDQDGLTNGQEYNIGTNPNDPDSDDGGESDGSEVRRQRDPLDPQDDGVRFSGELYVEPGNGKVSLSYPVLPAHLRFQLFRGESPDGPFILIGDQLPTTGAFIDEGATNGTTYYYRLAAVGQGEAVSAPSDPAEATPRADPIAPAGVLVVAGGAPTTGSRSVTLLILGSDDGPAHLPGEPAGDPARQGSTAGLQMRVSNDPSFAGASWEPYARTKPWQLGPNPGPAVVYVQLRDAAGNESELISDAITLSGATIFLPIIVR